MSIIVYSGISMGQFSYLEVEFLNRFGELFNKSETVGVVTLETVRPRETERQMT